MQNKLNYIKISKFLSLVLRHKPQLIGIELDAQGWTDVGILIIKMQESGKAMDFDTLKMVVGFDNKQRYAFNTEMTKIRASQGHSVNIDLGYEAKIPPEILFHGTGQKSVNSILNSGLEKRNRHHVHLSPDIETALKVGRRHGNPVVFEVLAGKMYRGGFEFFISENGVWLCEHVPPAYLKIV